MSKATLSKCFLVFIFLCSFIPSRNVFAEVVLDQNEYPHHSIQVTANVPLTPEFSFILRENSFISSEKQAVTIGEEILFSAQSVGWKNTPLRSHLIQMRVTDTHSEEIFSASGTTDESGMATFLVKATEAWLGENVVQIIDMTYDEPIYITQQATIIVYQTETVTETNLKMVQKIRNHISETVVDIFSKHKKVTGERYREDAIIEEREYASLVSPNT
ncbi:MAG: hypothetical protein COZ86_02370 [Candidatus Moranbacteria bacterium CG_4_8_14_3_um_filter_41_13]|nr:MAG: hypothetical protein AUK58_00795 [Candidatus Moranbacteria bacterium CG2_30_41_165]PIV86426.1 MAG: hypothetical protein COW50_01465 [Candidatus Moranbacteria bacterium CG17_big_fil_post_rev_8_21_14_2_50_41_107]PIW94193.1 MAG: hypothetical protein COZ86_02370 [Candidatus Moranbacteria bacterium CG_4_8_14_3_um_filter_41_13]